MRTDREPKIHAGIPCEDFMQLMRTDPALARLLPRALEAFSSFSHLIMGLLTRMLEPEFFERAQDAKAGRILYN